MARKTPEERQGEIRRALVRLDATGGNRVLSGVAALSADTGIDAKTLSQATGLSEQVVSDIIAKSIVAYDGVTQDIARKVVARFFSQSVLVTETLMRDAVADYVRAACAEEDLSQKLENAANQGLEIDQIALNLDEARAWKAQTGHRMLFLQKEFSNIMKNMGIAALFIQPKDQKDDRDKGIAAALMQTGEIQPDTNVANDAFLDEVAKERNELMERLKNFNKAVIKDANPN